jgi:hypothetical protein
MLRLGISVGWLALILATVDRADLARRLAEAELGRVVLATGLVTAARVLKHDRADYELFVWRVGTPPEQAIRLTHHPGNDQWPAIWATSKR